MHNATMPSLEEVIAEHGGRMTKSRREIFSLLKNMPMPLTIQELVRRSSSNEVSVYRTVRFLKDAHLVEEIAYPDGSKRYALGGHHHHIICTSCGYTEHLSCKESSKPQTPHHPQFKKVDHHEVTYYGTCVSCA